MKVTGKHDISEKGNEMTAYDVLLDDGRRVRVIRLHFPGWSMSVPMSYVESPHDADIDCGAVLDFLRRTHEDFALYSLIRKHKSAFRPVREICYSREQAEYLADRYLSHTKPENIEYLRILRGKDVVADLVSPSE